MGNDLKFWGEVCAISDYSAKIDAMVAYCKDKPAFYSKKWADQLLAGKYPIYIWGAGQFGLDLYEQLLSKMGISVEAYCDNAEAKWDTFLINGIRCISPAELMQRYQTSPCQIIIASNYYADHIYRQCANMGIQEQNLFPIRPFHRSWLVNYYCATQDGFIDAFADKIKWLMTQFSDDTSKQLCAALVYRRFIDYRLKVSPQGTEYFIPEFPIREGEVFVDVGAYTGDTLVEFSHALSAQSVSSTAIQYYALECGPQNYAQLTALCKQEFGFSVKAYQAALWDQNTTLRFSENLSCSQVCESGAIEVQAHKLDDLLADTPVTWIKMDIEGAELRALHGCEQLIRKNHPRLSICVYHCPNDIIEIPRYIKSLNPDYKMLLRHHDEYDNETILYAF